MCERRSRRGFVPADIFSDLEPVGNEVRGSIAVIKFGDEGAIFVFINRDDHFVATHHVPLLAKLLRGQFAQGCPFLVVQVERGVRNLPGPSARRTLCPNLRTTVPSGSRTSRNRSRVPTTYRSTISLVSETPYGRRLSRNRRSRSMTAYFSDTDT